MKIEIEISEEDAACIWADFTWLGKSVDTVGAILADNAKEIAERYRRTFPAEASLALESFRCSTACPQPLRKGPTDHNRAERDGAAS